MVPVAGRRLVWCLDNPAIEAAPDDVALGAYRRVRDALCDRIARDLLDGGDPP